MEQVRKSELQMRSVPPPPKKMKSLDLEIEASKAPDDEKLDLEEEEVNQETLSDSESLTHEEQYEMALQEETLVEDPKPIEKEPEQHPAEQTVTFIDYVLEHREKNGQKSVSVRVDKRKVKISKSYDFNVVSHSDPNCIYSCKYCVKAFGNLELLMKHLTLCHVCITCLAIKDTYNELNEHLKEDHKDQLKCPFCNLSLALKAFRPHMKKHHVKNLPNYYSIVAES